jgi:hypothetical protein
MSCDFDARLDLTIALDERDRLRHRYEEVAGTPLEIRAFVDLHAANERVAARERYLDWSEGTPLVAYPHPADSELDGYLLCDECSERFEVSDSGTDDRVQFDLGTAPSSRLAAELNREAIRGGEPPICPHCQRQLAGVR